MYHFHYLGKNPYMYLCLGSHVPLGEACTTFTHQSIFNSLTPILPTVLRTKDLMPLATLPFATKALDFHPHRSQACPLHENLALINFACMLISLLICYSLLCPHLDPFTNLSSQPASILQTLSYVNNKVIKKKKKKQQLVTCYS